MCKPSEAQVGFVYCAADEVTLAVTEIDREGGVLNHGLVGSVERYIRKEDGTFEEVRFDPDASGGCPWKTTGRIVRPPHKLKEAGRFVPTPLS